MPNRKIGDKVIAQWEDKKIELEITAVKNGRMVKARAIHPEPWLGKIGFFLEGEDWVVFDFDILTTN